MSYQIIGKITGFKGLKGEMKVKSLSGFMLERLLKGSTIYIKKDDVFIPYIVQSYHENQKYPLLILKGYETIESVQEFKQRDIYIDGDSDLVLPDDTYHQDELIGLKVYQNKLFKGEVIDIKNYPQYDYLLVRTKTKDVLIPFIDEFIIYMDDTTIELVDMEGLF